MINKESQGFERILLMKNTRARWMTYKKMANEENEREKNWEKRMSIWGF